MAATVEGQLMHKINMETAFRAGIRLNASIYLRHVSRYDAHTSDIRLMFSACTSYITANSIELLGVVYFTLPGKRLAHDERL